MKRIRFFAVLLAVSLCFTQFAVSSFSATKDDISRVPCSTIPTWQAGIAYSVGQTVKYQGYVYRVTVPHTSQIGWEPPNATALFTGVGPCTS